METIGDKIYNVRKSKGMSQEELASKIGVSRQAISQWETNALNPKLDKILALCELFNVNSDYFLTNAESTIIENEVAKTSEQKACTDFAGLQNNEGNKKLSLKSKLLVACITVFTVLIIATAVILICLFSYPEEGDDTVVSISFGLTNGGIIAMVSVVATILIITNFIIIFSALKKKNPKDK